MAEPNTRPWERDYSIKQTLVLAETPELRVIDLTLAPRECVPWHLHPDNDDLFICLRGSGAGEVRLHQVAETGLVKRR